MSDLTVVAKTLLRPEKCRAMLVSLREHFDGPVVVADDGGDQTYPWVGDGLDVEWLTFPYDAGIGHCLNKVMADHVHTPYVALLDDDFLVTERTDMARWIPFIEHGVYDIVGGSVCKTSDGKEQCYVGTFEWGTRGTERTLTLTRLMVRGMTEPLGGLDIVMNFFAASLETLRAIGWDELLKVHRHEDWFLRARSLGFTVGYHPGVQVMHDGDTPPYPSAEYRDLRRKRIPEYRQIFLDKWGLTSEGLKL